MNVRIETLKTNGYILKNLARTIDISKEKSIFGNIEGAKTGDWSADRYPDVVADFIGRNGEIIYSRKNSMDFSDYYFTGKSSFKIDLSEIHQQCDINTIRRIVLYIVFKRYPVNPPTPPMSANFKLTA